MNFQISETMMACIREKPRETIHSGHFMVSEIDESTEAEEEQDTSGVKPEDTAILTEDTDCAPTDEDTSKGLGSSKTMAQEICELYADRRPEQQIPTLMNVSSFTSSGISMKPTSSQMIPTERLYTGETKSVTIDASLAKLFACMSLAYQGNKITSPRWKNFKGLRLKLKDKIRLNNIIWRAWHIQYVKNSKPLVCQFSVPNDYDKSHNKPEAIVLEGKYWRRKLKAVFSEYQKWRVYFKNKTKSYKPHTFSAIRSTQTPQPQSSDNFWTSFMGETSAASGAFGPSTTASGSLEAEDFTMDFTDSFFNSLLSNNTNFEFPNPREISHPGMSADLIQPGLVQLQPTPMDDFMDMEPFDLLMSSYQNQQTFGSIVRPLPTLQEETMEGVSSAGNYSNQDTQTSQGSSVRTSSSSGVIQAQNQFLNQFNSQNVLQDSQSTLSVDRNYQLVPFQAESNNLSTIQMSPNLQTATSTGQDSSISSAYSSSNILMGSTDQTPLTGSSIPLAGKNATSRLRKNAANWSRSDNTQMYAMSEQASASLSKEPHSFMQPCISSQPSNIGYQLQQRNVSGSQQMNPNAFSTPQMIQSTYSNSQTSGPLTQVGNNQSIQQNSQRVSTNLLDPRDSYLSQQGANASQETVQPSSSNETQQYMAISSNFAVPRIPSKLSGKNRSRSANSNLLVQQQQQQHTVTPQQDEAKIGDEVGFSSTERLAQILRTMAKNESKVSSSVASSQSDSARRQLERTNSLPSYTAPRKSQNNLSLSQACVVTTIQAQASSFPSSASHPLSSNQMQLQPTLITNASQPAASSNAQLRSNFSLHQSNYVLSGQTGQLEKSPSNPSLSSQNPQSASQFTYNLPAYSTSKKVSIDSHNPGITAFSLPSSTSANVPTVNLNLVSPFDKQSSSLTSVTQAHPQVLNVSKTGLELAHKAPQRRLTPTELQRKISPPNTHNFVSFQTSSYPFQAISPGSSSPIQCSSNSGLNISFNGTSLLGTCPLAANASRKGKSDEEIHQYREHRRVCHINAEQKRRCNIKNGFDTLRSMLPGLSANSNAKISKAAMLQKAGEYIRALKIERSAQQEEYDTLKEQINQLNQTISVFQSQLPATGASVPCQKTTQVLDYYDEYVRIRTLQNWKFWIFSLIMDTLLDSYNSTVSTSSVDELCKGVLRWVDQNCSLVLLRKDVLNSLRKISTTTNILTMPDTLPEEAVKAVSTRRSRNTSNVSDLHA